MNIGTSELRPNKCHTRSKSNFTIIFWAIWAMMHTLCFERKKVTVIRSNLVAIDFQENFLVHFVNIIGN